jgi:hypothetical protein
MRRLLLLGLAIIAPGCADGAIEAAVREGRIVRVQLDDAFSIAEREEIRAGVHYWNAVDARLRLDDEAPEAELAEAPRLYFERSAAPASSTGAVGQCWRTQSNRIVLFMGGALSEDPPISATVMAAHEAGHAMGIWHIDDLAVMNASPYWLSKLSTADVLAFELFYGSRYYTSPSTTAR